MARPFFKRAFSLLELLLAMGLSACVLGGLGYWMMHGSQLAQTVQYVLADKDACGELEQALRADFAHICPMQDDPWLVYSCSAGKIYFDLLTRRGRIRYEQCPQGWQRIADQGAIHVFKGCADTVSFSIWGRRSVLTKWVSIDAIQIAVVDDKIALLEDEQTYIFGWLELSSTSTPERVMHRFRPVY